MGNMYFGPNHGQINIIQNNIHQGYRRSPRRNSHPILTGIGILFAIGLLIKFWWVVLTVLAIWIGVKAFRKWQHRQALAEQERARIAARADVQNQAFLAGDPYGIYGSPQDPQGL
ncbi:hypothetical protein [Rhodococcus opacus]|uniref:hypothetical protein n=1 Tax=Rhodococcus opacus TaxID=37919 RepID=UPI001F5761C1|nr:hypothetical protein [Rhodococcus opacus]UNN05182.1 hypothetical protein MOO23_40435 [Rhodococcus opacus]